MPANHYSKTGSLPVFECLKNDNRFYNYKYYLTLLFRPPRIVRIRTIWEEFLTMDIQQTIGFQIKQLTNQLNRVARQQITAAELSNIPETQQWVLSYLYDHQAKEIFQSDLQQTLGFGKSTISELLARMQKNDLIWLKQSTKDHRRKQVLLTTTSLQKAAIVNQSIRTVEKQLTNGLTNNRLTELFQLIQQLKQNLKYINSNKE